MMKYGFILVSMFWLVSPVGYLVGRAFGIWNFKYDFFIFLGLMVMSGISAFLNYDPRDWHDKN